VFQWLPADGAKLLAHEEPVRQRACDEMADVLPYLVRLADVLDVDLLSAATHKMMRNARKHPPQPSIVVD